MAEKEKIKSAQSQATGVVYFFGLIGAAVYYVQNAQGFWEIVLGILKAIIWPGILVYEVFTRLNL